MSWKDQNSIKRIFNTFKRLKPQIYSQDIEALKQLSESVENAQKSYVNDNLLYAKLLAVILRLNFEYYGNMKIAIKETENVFKEQLHNHIIHLSKSLNRRTEIDYLKSIGIDFDSYQNDTNVISEKQKVIIEQLKKGWTKEAVEKSFYNTANYFLQDINNYQ